MNRSLRLRPSVLITGEFEGKELVASTTQTSRARNAVCGDNCSRPELEGIRTVRPREGGLHGRGSRRQGCFELAYGNVRWTRSREPTLMQAKLCASQNEACAPGSTHELPVTWSAAEPTKTRMKSPTGAFRET